MTTARMREIAHDLVAVLGLLMAAQGPIVDTLTSAGVPAKAISAGLAVVGAVMALASRWQDAAGAVPAAVPSIPVQTVTIPGPVLSPPDVVPHG